MKSIQVRDAADGFILVDQKKEQELTGRNSFTFPPLLNWERKVAKNDFYLN